MTIGTIVKYSQPQEGEEGYRFEVLEDNGDRLLIRSITSGLPFPPVETVRLDAVTRCTGYAFATNPRH